MGLVIPAVLPYSKEEFEEELALFSKIPFVSRVQIDVVDGEFASPASWPYSAKATQGTPYTDPTELQSEMLPNLDKIEYEIDLMCFDAEQAAQSWLEKGATRIIFHAESTTDLPRLLASARRRYGAISLGLALNVTSDLALIEPCLGEIEFVQFMGIAIIGRQGQPFDKRVLEKVRIFKVRHPEIPVQVDGGISFESAKNLVALNVSNLVIGSGILRSNDPASTAALFEELHSSYGV